MTSGLIAQGRRAGETNVTGANPAQLRSYYFLRAGVAALWVAAAFTIGKADPVAAATLLIAYPAWDAIANLIDAKRNGGIERNVSQGINIAVSGMAAVAVAIVIGSMNVVLGVFGAWAFLAGLLQLATGVRRWKAGAQWAMILSGAQAALAGCLFVKGSLGSAVPGIGDVAPYAAFGAFYFGLSALWLTVRRGR
ncbi:DUF308 domain-containing protein [Sphingomonas sp. BIUV-7]|uniref:DUF308 domain-containing protein n=1 Tax=Sphingomonas natans TaxID=3063330 RepID=A0ABT8YCB1_9SPHN|nr:DUF308 domain-containing protein [Sphingomonas sp. BIUV-7]MDO6415468.1 DUF308 domain-containing protein [Sphingomonas sp. BIUV-7]